jgi:hypothetical protein
MLSVLLLEGHHQVLAMNHIMMIAMMMMFRFKLLKVLTNLLHHHCLFQGTWAMGMILSKVSPRQARLDIGEQALPAAGGT